MGLRRVLKGSVLIPFSRVLGTLACATSLLSLGCSKSEAASEGEPIRPEISALPPEMRPAAEAPQKAAPAAPAHAAGAQQAEGWNDAKIAWQPYEAGLARAKAEHKPVCVVLYTNWCPHCRNYSHVFEDPRVVEKSKRFVMIRANADDETAISAKYASDGVYVPRTYFLASDGTADPEIHAPRPKYKYFYDERDATSILGGMDAALARLK